MRTNALLALVLSSFALSCQTDDGRAPEALGRLTQPVLRAPSDAIADRVLGQGTATTGAPNGLDARGLSKPAAVALDTRSTPNRLYVADTDNNRVLLWLDSSQAGGGKPADKVFGQADFQHRDCPALPTAETLCAPSGVAVDDQGTLYVADSGNNRVVAFDAASTGDTTADRVFGQPDLTSNGCDSVSDATLCDPRAVAFAQGRLFVADGKGNRVLRYDAPRTSGKANAAFGQGNLASSAPNSVDGRGASFPFQLVIDRSTTPSRVWVSDSWNNRVLGWSDLAKFQTGAAADKVLGQPDLFSNACRPVDRDSLCEPAGIAVDKSGNVYVVDGKNHRMLEYDSPFTTDALADRVFGQAGSFTSSSCPQATTTTRFCETEDAVVAVSAKGEVALGLTGEGIVQLFLDPLSTDTAADATFGSGYYANLDAKKVGSADGLTFDAAGNLWVADGFDYRVLVFNPPASGGTWDTTADRVFGQPDFFSDNATYTPGASAFNAPGSLAFDDAGNLWMADNYFRRVLGFKAPLTTDFVADVVIGQSSFTANATAYSPDQAHLGDYWVRATTDGANVYLSDADWNRAVRVDNPFATGADALADAVFLQPDFTSEDANRIDERGVNHPTGVAVDTSVTPARLWVTDEINFRALSVPDALNFASGAAADKVLGQVDFSHRQTGGTKLYDPAGVAVDAAGNVYVADTLDSRIFEYDKPATTDATADRVLGQSALTSSGCNKGGIGVATVCGPQGLAVDSAGNLWAADTKNHRVLRYDQPTTLDTSADAAVGQASETASWPNYVDAAGLSGPARVAIDGSSTPNRIYVADTGNNRVLGWPSLQALTDGQPATLVLGQPSMGVADCATSTLCEPKGLVVDGTGRLYVADSKHNRVVYFDKPFTTDTTVDGVFGQADQTGKDCNRGGSSPSATSLCTPSGVALGPNGELYVADTDNNRVVGYLAPLTDTTADIVLGQPDFATADTPYLFSQTTLSLPQAVAVDTQGRVFVADVARVVGFKSVVAQGNRATLLLGQVDFSVTYCTKSPGLYLCDPYDVAVDAANRLYVADWSNSRVVRYDDPFRNGSVMAAVYGQPSRGAYDCNNTESAPGPSTMCSPQGVALDANGSLYVADTDNNRVLVFFSNRNPTATDPFISPAPPNKGATLRANYVFSDPDGDTEAGSEIRWYMKPSAAGSYALQTAYNDLATVSAAPLAKGQYWQFSVRPKDGLSFGPLVTSGPAIVANTPPTATNAKVTPETAYTDTDLTASYQYADADGDAEKLPAKIEWFVNGVLRPGVTGATVPNAETKRGEFWSYRVTVNDGTSDSAPVSSTFVLVLNSAPVADAGPDVSMAATGLQTRVTLDASGSTDADLDLLDFKWTESGAPLGGGKTLAVDFGIGIHDVTLTVEDPEGAVGTDTVRIVIGDVKPVLQVPAARTMKPGRVALAAQATDGLGRPMTYQWTQTGGPTAALDGAQSLNLSLFARTSGVVDLELVASAGSVASEPGKVSVTVDNLAPVAHAGPRQVVRPGVLAKLDGRRTADANGDALTFAWAAEQGALENGKDARAGFRHDKDGVYAVTLTAEDGVVASAPATTTVQVLDDAVAHAPVANAGPDQQVTLGQVVVLDGSASFDADGDRLRYRWRIVSGPAEDGLKNTTSSKAQLKPTAAGVYELGLVVGDAAAESAEDTVRVEVSDGSTNQWPVARAGANASGVVGVELALDGSRSADPDGDPLVFKWQQLDGAPVVLTGADTATPKLVPTVPGLLRFKLTVADTKSESLPAYVWVAVAEGANRVPVATVADGGRGLVGSAVTLDASASSDADGDALDYVWEQLAGPPIPLDDATTARPKFTAKSAGRYVFRALVSDGKSVSLPADVTVEVSTHGADNHAPVASAGIDRTVAVGTEVELDGSGSTDADPLDVPALGFHWTMAGFPTGAEPALTGDDLAKARFTPTTPGDYTVRLVVTDGDLTGEPAFVRITATADGEGKACGCSSSGSGSSALLVALFGLSNLLRRRRSPAARGAALSGGARGKARWAVIALALLPAFAAAAPRKKTPSPTPPPQAQPKPADAPLASPPPAAEAPKPGTNPFLEEAKALYANFQFEGILAKLEFALAAKDVTQAQRLEIYKLMAFTHAAYDDAPKAEQALLKILLLEPTYELKGVSPKLRGYFDNAKKAYRATLAVKLEHTPPQASLRGATTSVDVHVAQGEERIKAMTLHYRFQAEPPAPYSEIRMTLGEGLTYSAPVPNLFPGAAERRKVEYFVRARGEANEPLATVGEEAKPLTVEVETVDSSRPFYRNPFFWGGSAVAVGAAIAVPILMHTPDAAVQPGSLGKERLP